MFTHLRAAQAFQQAMAGVGVLVALEEFGSGLNSFQLLTHFDADLLKLDRLLVQELASNADNQRRIREIADKAHELGKRVIADHVQDAGSMSILFSAGIDYAQGHFLATAGPLLDYDFQ